jgi:cupin 2 domain-containing protein
MQEEVKIDAGNLLKLAESLGASEVATVLLERPGLRVERIVSTGQSSAPGFWYDQEEDEWVALLTGAARIDFEDGSNAGLAPGDHVLIPAHRRHRVGWTHPSLATIWLAVFVKPEG